MKRTLWRKATGTAAVAAATVIVVAVVQTNSGEADADDPMAADPAEVLSAADEYDDYDNDDSITVTPDGVIISDPPPVGPVLPALMSAGAPMLDAEAPSIGEVLSLSSRPSAERVIFLDFDGHSMSNTPWNSGRASTIALAPYSTDGNASFSASERQSMFDIWARVAEDFAPFDVNVTTADPGVERLRRSSGGDQQYGVRVVITPSSSWYGTAGGVAYVSSFAWSSDTPAFVFSNHLGGGFWAYVAEATSHEIGHTAGLYHDGTSGSAYYSGHGDWGPIMGASYLRDVTQWSRGDYPGANNGEDDLAKLAAAFGMIDGGPATVVPIGGSPVRGVITRTGETRTFETVVGAGTMTVKVEAADHNNLYAVASVLDADDNVMASMSTGSASDWVMTRTLTVPAGTYRVEVTGVGYGTAAIGFSNYGSLGSFRVSVNASGGVNQPDPGSDDPVGDGSDLEGALLTPIDPQRLVDTREGRAGAARLRAGSSLRINVRASAAVPASATAAVLNVTAVRPADRGYLSVNPCNGDHSTSALNYLPGENVPNSIIATLSDDGAVCVFSIRDVDVVVDVTAWLGPDGSSKLRLLGPKRVADSRKGLGFSRRLDGNSATKLSLAGVLSPGATGAALNVTVVGAPRFGNVSVFPCSAGGSRTSTVNFVQGAARANNIIVKVDSDRSVCVRSTSAAHVVVDVLGEFGASGLTYVPATPDRLQDTRRRGGALNAGSETTFRSTSVAGTSRIPAAVSANVTAVANARGYVTAWNCSGRPSTSTLNATPERAVANGALVPLASDGRGCLFAATPTNLIVDLNGWWID